MIAQQKGIIRVGGGYNEQKRAEEHKKDGMEQLSRTGKQSWSGLEKEEQ